MSAPAPPPRPETDDTDPRIAKVQRFLGLLTWAEPALPAIHELGARLPEECISLMANDLVSIWFTVAANLPSYWRWYHEQDLTAAYQRHRRQLQLLQRHLRADRWVLKAPVHMHGLAYLLDVYPDARVVFTHRNPAEVVASSASLIVHFQRALADGVDPHATGALMLESMVQYHERARAARAAAESRSDRRCVFLDVDYADVVRAPLETVERIYRTFSLPFGEPVRRRMQDYLAENAQHRHGVHRYELGQFGLSRAQVEERFPATERV